MDVKQPTAEQNIVQFFDEMNIIRTEKRQRVKTALYMLNKMNGFYARLYKDLLDGRFLHEKSEQEYIDDLITIYFAMVEYTDKTIVYDSSIVNKANQFANYIMQTNRRDFEFANDPELQSMVMMGVPIPEKRLPSSVKNEFETDGYRAVNAATNESLFVHNYIRHKNKMESGQATHTWETMKDEKVRPAHVAADGQTVPIDEPFIVGGYKLMYPGDTLTSNPPGDLVINCRCVEL